jgi:uncharacterized protein (TIGR03067 family)
MKSSAIATGLAWIVLLVSAGGVLRGDEEKVEGDLKTLQGKWTAKSGQGGTVTYTFKGNKLSIKAPSRSYEMTVTLDEKAKDAKAIDFKIDEAPDDAKGKTSKGIYKLDGKDKFIFSFRVEGDRPTEFKMEDDFSQILVTLERAKD